MSDKKLTKKQEQAIGGFFDWLISLLSKIFGGAKKILPSKDYRNMRVLKLAAKEIGVKEVSGSGSNKIIDRYYDEVSATGDSPHKDDVPWCGAYVGAMVKRAKMGIVKTALTARSWAKWGVSTRKKPLPGDLAVYWRGSRNGWKGHVGFFLKETDSFIYTLGGNQSNAVNVSRYSKSKLLDIRRSSKHIKLTKDQENELHNLAKDIIAGKRIETDGKVT